MNLSNSDLNQNNNQDTIKIVCISDTHTRTNNLELPKGDILIHAGDFSYSGEIREIKKFCDFLNQQDFKYKVIIAGNHDLTFDQEKYDELISKWHNENKNNVLSCKETKALLSNCIYLENSGVEIMGYKFWGSPVTPIFYDWAFMKERGNDIKKVWDMIPLNTDVLITHGPPFGILDKCDPMYNNGKVIHAGCEELLKIVTEKIKPKYHIFGHIHEAYGKVTINETTFVNASICNIRYFPDNPPIVIDLPRKNNV